MHAPAEDSNAVDLSNIRFIRPSFDPLVYYLPKTTASGLGLEEVRSFRCIARTRRLSLLEGPFGQEGEPNARLEKPVPCTMGMQVSCSDRTEVPPQGILRKDANSDRSATARPVPTAGGWLLQRKF